MITNLTNYQFKLTLKKLLLGLLLVPVLISLGFWQLHRANFKRELQAQYNSRAKTAPVPLAQALMLPDNNFQPVKLHGSFDNNHVILLDNKFYNHQTGYHVLVVFKDQETAKNILVNLGWIPQGVSRQQLPRLKPITEKVLIHGVIHAWPKPAFSLGALTDPKAPAWPLRLQQLNQPLIQQKLGYPLAPFMVVLAPNEPFGYTQNWSPAALNPQMHIGYAFQWFALAATLVILLLVTSFKRKEKNAHSY